MAFRPNMTVFTQGIRACQPLDWRAWDGVVADLWHAEGRIGGGGHYLSPDPRVVVFLDDGADAVRLSQQPDFATDRPAARVFYVPAGAPLWSRITETRRFRHLDLHFDATQLAARMAKAGAPAPLDRLIAGPGNPRLLALAGMIAQECAAPSRHEMLLEGLTLALLAEVFALAPADPARGGLTPLQMQRLTAHMRAALHRRVPIAELAAVAGLSESWFAHAFKQTTGSAPYRWQVQQRIDFACEMLADPALPLTDVALATGFADQAHLTRAFRGITGTTPASWRRSRAGIRAIAAQ